jgi:coproporphyrinogen III oxidase-like Fe-S oxidoreductase
MASKFPLSLYIHLPWCEKKCPYCDFNVTTNIPNNFSNFSKALIDDLEASSDWIQNRKFSSIYFGGGTPSLADPSLHESIIKWLTKNNFATIPALSTKYPMNKKSGTAVRTLLSITV